jgi:hypothetical protein
MKVAVKVHGIGARLTEARIAKLAEAARRIAEPPPVPVPATDQPAE